MENDLAWYGIGVPSKEYSETLWHTSSVAERQKKSPATSFVWPHYTQCLLEHLQCGHSGLLSVLSVDGAWVLRVLSALEYGTSPPLSVFSVERSVHSQCSVFDSTDSILSQEAQTGSQVAIFGDMRSA